MIQQSFSFAAEVVPDAPPAAPLRLETKTLARVTGVWQHRDLRAAPRAQRLHDDAARHTPMLVRSA